MNRTKQINEITHTHTYNIKFFFMLLRFLLTYFVREFFASYRHRQRYAGGDVLGERGADGHAIDDVVETVSEQHQQG